MGLGKGDRRNVGEAGKKLNEKRNWRKNGNEAFLNKEEKTVG